MIGDITYLEGSSFLAVEVYDGAVRCKLGRGKWGRHFEYEIHQDGKEPLYYYFDLPEGVLYYYMCLKSQCKPDGATDMLYRVVNENKQLSSISEYALFMISDIPE